MASAKARGLLGIAGAIAGLALLSKGFGFFRELVVAYAFGAGVAKDAYTAAYIIPGFALVMLGGLTGPFHTAMQKVITTMRERGQDEAVPGVTASILLSVSAVMGALSIASYLAAPFFVHLVASQASPPVFALAVAQLQIMSPLMLLGGLIGLLCGISNDRGDYTLPSLSPLVASLAVIAVVLFRRDPLSLAWGTTMGGVGQFLLQAPAGWKLLFERGRPRLNFRHGELRAMWWLLLPACISSTIGTINVIIGTNFASALPKGDISVFDYANKLIQLPLGILMTALLIPLFPLLAQAAVAGNRPALFRWMNRGLGAIAIVTLPLVALFIAVGEPMVAVMYQRGAFDAHATHQTYIVLAFVSLGIVTYGARDLMIRVFYALDDSRTPLLVSLASMAATAGLMALLIGPYQLPGLAAATAIVTGFNCLLVGLLLRRKLGELPIAGSLKLASTCALAAAIAGGVTFEAGRYLPFGSGFANQLARLGVETALLGAVYLGLLWALGVPLTPYLGNFLARFKRRPPPGEPPAPPPGEQSANSVVG